MARAHALVALLAIASPARAEVIDLPDTYAAITLDTRTWHPVQKPGLAGFVWGATTDRGELLAITRAQVPNIDAWRSKTRDAYVAQIEAGLVNAGYKTRSKKLTTIEGVPVLDVEATRKRTTIVMRVILFRTYALSLAIEGARSRSKARAIAKTFVPPPARPEGSP